MLNRTERAAVVAAILLMLAGVLRIATAAAQTPWAPTIRQYADPAVAPCLIAINAREDGYGSLNQPNLQGGGATGLFQIEPSTWQQTPPAQRGVPLSVATAAEQVEAATALLMSHGASDWSPAPAGC